MIKDHFGLASGYSNIVQDCCKLKCVLTAMVTIILNYVWFIKYTIWRCVSCCGFRRWHALHMFMESFQGEYKYGTNGTCDFRMVFASFFILRILTLVSFYKTSSLWVSADFQGVLLVCATCFYAVVRPYKHNFRNITDILTLAVLEATSLNCLLQHITLQPYKQLHTIQCYQY